MAGKAAPEAVKPLPEIVAALMVNGAAPDEVRISDCVVGVLIVTLPKARLPELTLSAGVPVLPAEGAFNCNAKVCVLLPALAVNVAVCAALTLAAVAVNDALVAPVGTVTLDGTVTAVLLLARVTLTPLVAAALRVTEQLSASVPVMVVLVQERALTEAAVGGALELAAV